MEAKAHVGMAEAASMGQVNHAEKVAAKAFVDNAGLLPVLDDMLNAVGGEKPRDAVGFCAQYLIERQAPPTIIRLAACETINSAGVPAVRVSCIARVLNENRVMASATVGSSVPTFAAMRRCCIDNVYLLRFP